MVTEEVQKTKLDIWNMTQQVCCRCCSRAACCVERNGEYCGHLQAFYISQNKEIPVFAVFVSNNTAPLEKRTK